MNTKNIAVLLLVLVVFVAVQEAYGFTAGGGGNIPGAGKREFMVVSKNNLQENSWKFSIDSVCF